MNANLIYVGLIRFKKGWYRLYTDGDKHYSFEKEEED